MRYSIKSSKDLRNESVKVRLALAILIIGLAASAVSVQGGKAEPMRISFAAGKTSATLTGTLSNNQQMEYVFSAKKGQSIMSKVSSSPKGRLFDFDLESDGFDLETEYDTYSDYKFTAPRSGDYLVFVRKRPTERVHRAKFYLKLAIK
ncbi:MAG TPA: hypothetical protein VNA17_02800 [Pyrinomonadaceae bacterium]|nr:hypothetical protein [Pyrinomonadaceae bacterium]